MRFLRVRGKAAQEGEIPIPKEVTERIKKEFETDGHTGDKRQENPCIGEASEEAAVWPILADIWLKSLTRQKN